MSVIDGGDNHPLVNIAVDDAKRIVILKLPPKVYSLMPPAIERMAAEISAIRAEWEAKGYAIRYGTRHT